MIEVVGLTRYYGDLKAIDGLSFKIASNEIVGFLGLNGAGKSTTLRILAGILLPTAGVVRINGQDMFDAPIETRKKTGFLPEVPPLHKEMTARTFLHYVGRLRGVSADALPGIIEDVAKRTSVDRVLDQVIGTLSWGYQKRVGIAQAIIHNPTLVVLDEPIAGLDPKQIVEIRDVIVRLKEHCTVLVSSHILSEISQTCDRILLLHQGRIVADGSEEILTGGFQFNHKVVMTLRGPREKLDPVMNGFPSLQGWRLTEAHDDLLHVWIDLGGDHREALVKHVVDSGFGVRRIDAAEAELEQLFVHLTREGRS